MGWLLAGAVLLGGSPLLRADTREAGAPPAGGTYGTRAEMLEAARREKIARPGTHEKAGLERGLLRVERERLVARLSAGFRGFHPLFGGLSTGSGFALGALYRRAIPPGEGSAHAAASASFKGYQRFEAGLEIDPVPSLPLTLEFGARYRNYPQEDYFGTGAGSRVKDDTDYRLEEATVGGRVAVRLRRGVTLRTGVGYRRARTAAGTASGVDSIEERFAPGEVPGFGRTFGQRIVRAAFDLDLRDAPGNPRSRVSLRLEQRRFEAGEGGPFRHRQTSAEFQGYLPFLHRHPVFALRLRGVDTDAGRDDRIPFFDLPTLGGHDTIRGFREFRFRDRKALLANLEYRFEAFIGLDAALFFDAGRVAAAWEAIRLADLETSWGGWFPFQQRAERSPADRHRARPRGDALVLQVRPCVLRGEGAVWEDRIDPPGPFFYPDDPIAEDRDRLPIPRPVQVEISQYFDFLENSFGNPGGEEWIPAADVNTLDEVPNSSWFTNRHGARRMSPEALARGPRTEGPDMDAPWTVVRGKSEGITPGFTIRDGRGDLYFVKSDPKAHPELATAAEVIATGFFHAIGYLVPANHLAFIDPARIRVGACARIRDALGHDRAMTRADLDRILAKAPVRADGTIRVVASRALDGTPLGHFRYYGTRPDDGNDIIPHQHRRELRGLRLFAAWLNHDDARSINTLDIYTGDDGAGSVRHYLIDFGSCLGSGSVKVQTRRAGNEYIWEPGPTLHTLVTLGLWVRPYLKVRYPEDPVVGRFEAEAFRPGEWVPEYPNPAFRLMDRADAFWAAKIVMAFTDEDVRVLVHEGRLDEPGAERYIADTLIERRERIGHYGFGRIPPLDRFLLQGDSLRFSNLAVDHGFAPPPSGYTARWRSYDNGRRTAGERIGTPVRSDAPVLPLPPPAGGGGVVYRVVEIRMTGNLPQAWCRPVRVYLRERGGGREIVGIDRGGRGEAP